MDLNYHECRFYGFPPENVFHAIFIIVSYYNLSIYNKLYVYNYIIATVNHCILLLSGGNP